MDLKPDHPEHPGSQLQSMPPGELREEAALQLRDLLVAAPRPTTPTSWQELFDVDDSRQLLARLIDGDPLSLRPRVLRACRENAWILHADRFLMRSLALCAYKGQLYGGSPPLERWCDDVVARAARDLMQEDLEREFDGELVQREAEVLYRLFGELFGIEPPLCRRASVRFHQASKPARRVVWRIALEGRSIPAAAELEDLPTEDADRYLRAVLAAMSNPQRPDLNDLTGEEDLL